MSEDDASAAAPVAGAGRGTGFEVSRRLAGRGMTVLLGVRSFEKAEDAVLAPAAGGLDVRRAGTGDASSMRAATLPDDGPTVGFPRDGKPLSW